MVTKILPGRPRSPDADRAILSAAVTELVECGYDSLSFEGIARRSGSSRATIYRRYANKAELLIAAVSAAFERANPTVPDTGCARTDVVTLVNNTVKMLTQTPVGGVFRAIVPALPKDKILAKLAHKLEKQRRQLMLTAIQRGVEKGDFSGDSIDLKIDAIFGAIYMRFLYLQKPVNRSYVEELVDRVLAIKN